MRCVFKRSDITSYQRPLCTFSAEIPPMVRIHKSGIKITLLNTMAKITLLVTNKSSKVVDGRTLISVRLFIASRSMWLNIDGMKDTVLTMQTEKTGTLDTDDTVFNSSTYEVLRCSNENGAYLKLVPKSGFKLAEF